MADSQDVECDLAVALNPYRELLTSFVEGRLPVGDFETTFRRMYLGDETKWTSKTFAVMDRFFSDVDEYVADPELRASVGGFGPEDIRGLAAKLLSRADLR